MDTKCLRSAATLAATLISLGVTGAAFAENKSGTDTVVLSQVYGVAMNGSRDPGADAACKQKYGSYLGQKITSKYDINTQSLIMSATSNVFGVPVLLHPMGLSDSYSFMSDGVPQALAEKGVDRVIFKVSKTFQNPVSDIMATLNATDNCVLSNAAP